MRPVTSKKENFSKEDPSSQVELLFESELRDIYWTEKALTLAIPEMIKSATSKELKLSLEKHLEDAENKVDEIVALLGEEPEARGIEGMKAIRKEAKELLKEGSWCYEKVTPSIPRRRSLHTGRFYNTGHYTRSRH